MPQGKNTKEEPGCCNHRFKDDSYCANRVVGAEQCAAEHPVPPKRRAAVLASLGLGETLVDSVPEISSLTSDEEAGPWSDAPTGPWRRVAHATAGPYILEIMHDEDATSPRENDNLGTMLTWDRGYHSPDKNVFADPGEFRRWWDGTDPDGGCVNCAASAAALSPFRRDGELGYRCAACEYETIAHGVGGIRLPVYKLDHSRVVYNTTGFASSDPQGWDWGQVGWTYATASEVAAEGVDAESVLKTLRAEVEVYSDWAEGACWGWVLSKRDRHGRADEIDACWGYFGDADWESVRSVVGVDSGLLAQMADSFVED